ncbi:cell division protein SepF, partial [Turicibacter sanguinis]|nr:cell division protein SepF [Turicibacter sanguinis]
MSFKDKFKSIIGIDEDEYEMEFEEEEEIEEPEVLKPIPAAKPVLTAIPNQSN